METLGERPQQRLNAWTTEVTEVLKRLSPQQRNACFHDLNEVTAKYAKMLSKERAGATAWEFAGKKRQCTLWPSGDDKFERAGTPSTAFSEVQSLAHSAHEASVHIKSQETSDQ